MFANRILASAVCLPLLSAVGFGQSFPAPPPTPPSALTTAEGGSKPFGGQWPAPTSLLSGRSAGLRPASATEYQPVVAAPPLPMAPPVPTAPTAADTLAGVSTPSAVPGAVYSPWSGDTLAGGCCGPVGANGPVTYELYARTGVNLLTGGGPMTAITKTFGWTVQGGTRSLLFNPTGDAAWVLDLGLGFTGNAGRGASRPINILTRAVKFGSGNGTFAVGETELRRTSLNFGVGRDYFLNGPGAVGSEPAYGNFRLGWDVGGRWGTASIGFEPFGDPEGYRRRQDVFHGLYAGGQGTWEKPMGGWTLYLGGRLEWGYYWTNLIPPNDGDFRDLNLMMVMGVRF